MLLTVIVMFLRNLKLQDELETRFIYFYELDPFLGGRRTPAPDVMEKFTLKLRGPSEALFNRSQKSALWYDRWEEILFSPLS